MQVHSNRHVARLALDFLQHKVQASRLVVVDICVQIVVPPVDSTIVPPVVQVSPHVHLLNVVLLCQVNVVLNLLLFKHEEGLKFTEGIKSFEFALLEDLFEVLEDFSQVPNS